MTEPASRFSDIDPAQLREVATSFGSDAERYDRTRPGYPQAMVDRLVAETPGRDMLDVGIGTGLSARPFRDAGCSVLGIDPDARMAEFARSQGFEVEESLFEGWDRAGRQFDLITSGQTWHWVDSEAGALLAADLLRPGGRIALFWNVYQPRAEMSAAFARVHRRVMRPPLSEIGSRPNMQMYAPVFVRSADGLRDTKQFSEPEQWRYERDEITTKEAWLDQVPTQGGYARLSPEQLSEVLDGMGAAIDTAGGSFVLHYTTIVVTAVRN